MTATRTLYRWALRARLRPAPTTAGTLAWVTDVTTDPADGAHRGPAGRDPDRERGRRDPQRGPGRRDPRAGTAPPSGVFGFSAAEAIGASIEMLLPDDRPDEAARILERVAAGEHLEQFDTRRMRKDGELIDVSLTISPLLDINAHVVGAATIARDITRRKAPSGGSASSRRSSRARTTRSSPVTTTS